MATLHSMSASRISPHMVKNLSEVLREILGHCRAEIRQAEASVPQSEKAAEEPTRSLPTTATCEPRTPIQVKKAHQARQASRDDRYEQMTILRAQGLTQREVATRMGMSEKAVRTWLKRGAAPTNARQFRRRSVFDPYAASVLQRWQAGVHEGKQLYEEIQAASASLERSELSSALRKPFETTQSRSRWRLQLRQNAFRPTPQPGYSSMSLETSAPKNKRSWI